MIDFKEISSDGEVWEQFSQEFLALLGLITESPPDRGADGGKDLLMIEPVTGPLHTSSFRWLVSCKHFAGSNTAVSEVSHEQNILERIKAFKADGFLGFYSTLPTAGLNTRLRQLVDAQEISSYRIFDGRLIEAELMTVGRSWLMRRYFPASYRRIRPLHALFDEFVNLECASCSRSLLDLDGPNDHGANVVFAKAGGSKPRTEHVYWACKGQCYKNVQRQFASSGLVTAWEDIGDLLMPNEFLRWLLALMSELRDGESYSDEAFNALSTFIMAISQKVFREVTEEEKQRVRGFMMRGN